MKGSLGSQVSARVRKEDRSEEETRWGAVGEARGGGRTILERRVRREQRSEVERRRRRGGGIP